MVRTDAMETKIVIIVVFFVFLIVLGTSLSANYLLFGRYNVYH